MIGHDHWWECLADWGENGIPEDSQACRDMISIIAALEEIIEEDREHTKRQIRQHSHHPGICWSYTIAKVEHNDRLTVTRFMTKSVAFIRTITLVERDELLWYIYWMWLNTPEIQNAWNRHISNAASLYLIVSWPARSNVDENVDLIFISRLALTVPYVW